MKTFYLVIIPLTLTIAFMACVWHMSTARIIWELGQTQTGGMFKISPADDFRYSEYGLITILFAYNLFVAYLIHERKK